MKYGSGTMDTLSGNKKNWTNWWDCLFRKGWEKYKTGGRKSRDTLPLKGQFHKICYPYCFAYNILYGSNTNMLKQFFSLIAFSPIKINQLIICQRDSVKEQRQGSNNPRIFLDFHWRIFWIRKRSISSILRDFFNTLKYE